MKSAQASPPRRSVQQCVAQGADISADKPFDIASIATVHVRKNPVEKRKIIIHIFNKLTVSGGFA
jgi:hypothetical protein